MHLFAAPAPKHAVVRRNHTARKPILTARLAVGATLAMATVAGALTAGTAAASPPVISAVGGTVSQTGTGITTLTGVNPQHVGDLMVAVDEQNDNTLTATSVSGGGVTTWTRAIQYVGVNEPREYEIWYGVVTSTGSSPIVFTLSGSNAGFVAEYEAQEFTDGLGSGTTWSLDTTGHSETVSSATVTYPSLNAAGAGELYYGFADMPSAPAAGMTSGFTYFTTADANQTAYNPAAGPGAVQPTSTQASAGVSSAVAAFFVVHAPAPAPAVTGVSPSGGPLGGGTSVTVTGTNFTGATAVDFGSTPGTGIVVNGGGTSLTVTAPAGAAGTVDVTVTTPSGPSATSPADGFTYFAVPTVTRVSPATGPGTGGTTVTVTGTNLVGASAVDFGFNPATHVVVSSPTSLTATAPSGSPGFVDVTVTTPGGTSATGTADRFTYQKTGYWMVGNDGGIFSFGGAPYEGSLPGLGIHVKNIVGLVPTSDGQGYWMIGSDGGVFAFGDAGFVGSLPGLGVHVKNIVGVVPTSTGKGYWMIGSDGGVFAFGDAGFVGSLPGIDVHVGNIVAAVPTSTGKGYWMIGSDGGVFAFGDAGFVGSLPGINVHVSNVVAAVPTSTGKGYWMIGSDGGVFAFGDAGFVGSIPGLGLHVTNIVGVVATSDGQGYWMVGSDGGVFAFGDAGFVGSIPGLGLHVTNIVAFAPQ